MSTAGERVRSDQLIKCVVRRDRFVFGAGDAAGVGRVLLLRCSVAVDRT